jgi:hypothetical protein
VRTRTRTDTRRGRLTAAGAAIGVGFLVVAAALPAAAATASTGARHDLSDCQNPGVTGAYPPATASITETRTEVIAGQSDTVTATGFAKAGQPGAGGTVTFILCSKPVTLGSEIIDAGGVVSRALTIPASTPAGLHIIQASGPNGRGGTTIESTYLTVLAATTTGTSSGALPFTGLDLIPLILAALALLVVGGALLVIGGNYLRRRTPA